MVRKLIVTEFLRANTVVYIAGLLALFASSGLMLVMPLFLGYITDGLNDRVISVSQATQYAFILLGMAVVLFGLRYSFRTILIGKSRDLECFLRDNLFEKLQSMPPSYYHEKKTGDLMAYAINDLNAIRMAFAAGIVFMIDGIILNMISIVVMAITIDLTLTIIAVVPVFASIFLVIWLRKKIREKFMKVQNSFAELSEKIQENITGIRVVKSFAQEKSEINKLNKVSLERYRVQMDYVKLSAVLMPLIRLMFGASFAVVIIFGSTAVVNGTITLGNFVAMNSYLLMLVMPIMRLSRTVEIWQRAFASINRLDDVLMAKSDVTDENADFSITELNGDIHFNGLNFTYPVADKFPNKNPPALHNINLTIKRGQTVGIIGSMGSGKSTLASLLLRLYPLESKKLTIGGYDINNIPLNVLRGAVGYSDNFMFATTILDNIKFFDSEITDEQAYEAAKLAGIYDNIMEFPNQFETEIGERGITLSGGQKQRIGIARAIAKNPDILILDDSLSAVDTETEEEIIANLKQLLKGKTGIIIAHRISAIKHADLIIYMDKGRIVERGTHEELLALKGGYYRLNSLQSLEDELYEQI